MPEGEYLADVGFGSFSFFPLKLEAERIQEDPSGTFRVIREANDYLLFQKQTTEGWEPQYRFHPRARALEEYAATCQFQQTSPDSHFVQKRLCTMPVQNGRLTITNNTFKRTLDGEVTEEEIPSETAFRALLAWHFGIRQLPNS